MENRVCEILDIEKPVIQAPMAWITSPDLVAAVSNAGGLGTLGFNRGFERLVMIDHIALAKEIVEAIARGYED